jgi:acyl-CoA synthetase (AMP-forming)/AMP-acid ligase II
MVAARAFGSRFDPALEALESLSLWELIERRAELSPDAPMAVDEGANVLTFAACREQGEQLAAALYERGIRPGDSVAWMLPTRIDAFVLVAALARLDVLQIPMLPIYREREISFVTQQASPRLLILPGVWRGFDYAAMVDAALQGLADPPEVMVLDGELPQGDPAQLPAPPVAEASPTVRWIFYTSGTTSDPKGALHTQPSVAACGSRLIERFAMTVDDRNALVFPFTHVGGIAWYISGLMGGFRHILIESFSATQSIAALSSAGITVAGAGPAFWQAYLEAQRAVPEKRLFPQLRALVGGGAPKPAGLHDDVREVFGDIVLATGFGLTECPMVIQCGVFEPPQTLLTDGIPVPGAELCIVRADDTVAEIDEVAEIRVKGPMLCAGYLDSALNADAFDSAGFMRTGDLGRIDANGCLHVTGRLKDIIIRKGENISAKEVEDVIILHPKVLDVAVVGLPDPERGERCCAVVVTRNAAVLTLEDIAEYCAQAGLMKQKTPEQLELVDELPRNPTGKVVKTVLRERYASPASLAL